MSKLKDKAFEAIRATDYASHDEYCVLLSDAEEKIEKVRLSELGIFNDYYKMKVSLESSYEQIKEFGDKIKELKANNKELIELLELVLTDINELGTTSNETIRDIDKHFNKINNE